MSKWRFKNSQLEKWNVEKKDGAYHLSYSTRNGGLESYVTNFLSKGLKRKDCKERSNVISGQRVIARRKADGIFYLGVVQGSIHTKKVYVIFDSGERRQVSNKYVIPISGAVQRPTIVTGDYVLVAARATETSECVCFIPGIVQIVPLGQGDLSKFSSILLYSSQVVTALHSHLIKISKTKFENLCKTLVDKKEIHDRLHRVFQKHLEPRCAHRKSCKSSEGKEISSHRNLSLPDDDNAQTTSSNDQDTSASSSRTGSRSTSRSTSRSSSSSRSSSGERSDHSSNDCEKQEGRLQFQQLYSDSDQNEATPRTNEKDNRLSKQVKEVSGTSVPSKPIHIPTIEVRDVDVNETIELNDMEDQANNRPTVPAHILMLRTSLAPLPLGSKVVAKRSSTGLYSSGGVIEECSADAFYYVKHSDNTVEKIFREDILHHSSSAHDEKLQVGDSVIASIPDDPTCFAPAKVIKHRTQEMTFDIEFYNGQVKATKYNSHISYIFPISQRKYDYDEDYIRICENQLIGHVVVARNDDTAFFEIGQVRQKIGQNARYVVKFANGTIVIQRAEYIFSDGNRRVDFAVGDKILAIVSPDTCSYLPGYIENVNEDGLNVHFCDNSKRNDVHPAQSFWLTLDKYNELAHYYQSKISK